MKRKPVMRFMTLMTAMMLALSMTTITAFAAGNNATGGDGTCIFSADECTDENCPVHGNGNNVSESPRTDDDQKTDAQDSQKTTSQKDQDSQKTDAQDSQKTTDQKDQDSQKTDAQDSQKTTGQKDQETGDKKTTNESSVSGNSANDSNMSATDANKNSETIKTGETDIVPVIICLAVIAAGAGIGYVVYKQKKK